MGGSVPPTSHFTNMIPQITISHPQDQTTEIGSTTNPDRYRIEFSFIETEMFRENQIAAGNDLFKPIREEYRERLLVCDLNEQRLFIVIAKCSDKDGLDTFLDMYGILYKTGLFHLNGAFVKPSGFEVTVSEEGETGLKRLVCYNKGNSIQVIDAQ
jgi:hypothetical protein